MGKEWVVRVRPLTDPEVEPFGRAVRRESGTPPNQSDAGWACWFPLGELRDSAPLEIGLVKTDPRPRLIGEMERHQDREEWVFAIDEPLIQTVSLSRPGDPRRPDLDQAQAFLLNPGEGIVLALGTWHAPGLPSTDHETLYGFVLSKPAPGPVAETEGWVPFGGGGRLRVAL